MADDARQSKCIICEERTASVGEFLARDGMREDAAKAANMMLHGLGGPNYDYLREKFQTEQEFGHLLLVGAMELGKFLNVDDDVIINRVTDAWMKDFKYQAAASFHIYKDALEDVPSDSGHDAEFETMLKGLTAAYALFE